MLWADMSYNRVDMNFRDQIEEENKKDDYLHELNETNTLVFSGDRCVLRT